MKKRKKPFMTAIVAVVLITSVTACSGGDGKPEEADSKAPAGQQSAKLRLLGPTGSNKFIKFEDREKYPIWKEVDKLLNSIK